MLSLSSFVTLRLFVRRRMSILWLFAKSIQVGLSPEVSYQITIPSRKENVFHIDAALPAKAGEIKLHMFSDKGEPGQSAVTQ